MDKRKPLLVGAGEVCVCMNIYTYMYTHMYVYMYVICIYVCIYTHIYIHILSQRAFSPLAHTCIQQHMPFRRVSSIKSQVSFVTTIGSLLQKQPAILSKLPTNLYAHVGHDSSRIHPQTARLERINDKNSQYRVAKMHRTP